jgi:hypothetical protein
MVVTVLMAPFEIAVGSVLALPTALALGLLMVRLTERSPQLNRPTIWAVASIAVTIPSLFIVGSVYQ